MKKDQRAYTLAQLLALQEKASQQWKIKQHRKRVGSINHDIKQGLPIYCQLMDRPGDFQVTKVHLDRERLCFQVRIEEERTWIDTSMIWQRADPGQPVTVLYHADDSTDTDTEEKPSPLPQAVLV